MSLNSALAIASGSLANINSQLALVSQNVANASTPGYAREISTQQSLTADGIGIGVYSGPTEREVSEVLQASALSQSSLVSGLQTRQTALQAIDAAHGTPGQGTDLASLVGNLQDAFTALAASPSSQTQQQAVVASAGSLASGINALSSTVTTQRQTAQDAIASDVTTLNSTLQTVSSLTTQIETLKAAGDSTADLENQRDASLQSMSQLINVQVSEQSNGGLVMNLGSGLNVSLGDSNPFSVSAATVGPGSYYPGGGVPGVTLNGIDVTSQMTGGTIGANLTLRDTTLPTDQAELDEFSQALATRFDSQGLRLFSDPTGNVPTGGGTPAQAGYVGFAASIQVNPAVQANPAYVRDGTEAVAGSATGATAFTPNPAGGPAGFTGLTDRIIGYAFGTQVQAGVDQPGLATTGLGPTGSLNAPYSGAGSLETIAASLVGAQAEDSATTTSQLTTEQAVQTNLQSKIASVSGVSVDNEMATLVQLQNSYGASAHVISAVQAMWSQLLSAI